MRVAKRAVRIFRERTNLISDETRVATPKGGESADAKPRGESLDILVRLTLSTFRHGIERETAIVASSSEDALSCARLLTASARSIRKLHAKNK